MAMDGSLCPLAVSVCIIFRSCVPADSDMTRFFRGTLFFFLRRDCSCLRLARAHHHCFPACAAHCCQLFLTHCLTNS